MSLIDSRICDSLLLYQAPYIDLNQINSLAYKTSVAFINAAVSFKCFNRS